MTVVNPLVVNIRRADYDVYIGRATSAPMHDVPGRDGYFGNPIRVGAWCIVCGDVHERRETIPCFEVWARQRAALDPVYRQRVAALHGLRLGCFCAPRACHGHVLVQLAAEFSELGEVSMTPSSTNGRTVDHP